MKKLAIAMMMVFLMAMSADACATADKCSQEQNNNQNQINVQGQYVSQNNKQSNTQTNSQANSQSNSQSNAQTNNQSVSDIGNVSNSVNQTTVTEDKRELPNIITGSAPSMFSYRGPFKSGVFEKLAPWRLKEYWDNQYVESFPYCNYFCGDTVVSGIPNGIVDRMPFKIVQKSKLPNTMMVYMERSNPIELWGSAARFALENGIKEVVEMDYKVVFANKASGWNIGLGGGVSLIDGGSNDNAGGSVGAGIGFGSVETRPIEKVKAVFLMYW